MTPNLYLNFRRPGFQLPLGAFFVNNGLSWGGILFLGISTRCVQRIFVKSQGTTDSSSQDMSLLPCRTLNPTVVCKLLQKPPNLEFRCSTSAHRRMLVVLNSLIYSALQTASRLCGRSPLGLGERTRATPQRIVGEVSKLTRAS